MSAPTPDYPLDDFDRITAQVRMVSPLETMLRWAEEHLNATRPEGYTLDDLAQLTWDRLPEPEKEQALTELFSAYWEFMADDSTVWARYDTAGGAS
jgi:hypothetical protein